MRYLVASTYMTVLYSTLVQYFQEYCINKKAARYCAEVVQYECSYEYEHLYRRTLAPIRSGSDRRTDGRPNRRGFNPHLTGHVTVATNPYSTVPYLRAMDTVGCSGPKAVR